MRTEGNRPMKQRWWSCLPVALVLTSASIQLHGAEKKQQPLGIFEQATDIGEALPGSFTYDPVKKQYTITGGGADIWGGSDDFYFLWRKISGKWISLACTLELPPESDDPYPKAGLMFRKSLESRAPFVSVVLHANRDVALQFRRKTGGQTEQIISPIKGNRLMLERKDHWLVMWVGIGEGGGYVDCGSIVLDDFPETFYVGLAVCAHNADRLLTVHFSDVTVDTE
jgi:TolB protein